MTNKASNAPDHEFSEPRRERKQIGELPPSTDKEFWGEDAEINLIHKDQLPRHTPNCGDFKQQGPFVICGTCPQPHTIPGFSLNREGKLEKLDK